MAPFPAVRLSRIKTTIISYLRDFLLAQLTATALSLPILVCWGLPLSLMTLLGNLLFTPLLGAFIALSSLLFFTELCSIPNGLLAWAINHLVSAWDWCLSRGSSSWLVGFARPPWWQIALAVGTLVALAMVIMRQRPQLSPWRRIGSLAAFNVGFMTLLLLTPQIATPPPFPANQFPGLVVQQVAPGRITLQDHGFFSRTANPTKAIEYGLKPALTKHFGNFTIEHLATMRCSYRTLTGLAACCVAMPIKRVALPYFAGSLTKAGWRAFFQLRRTAREKKILLSRTKTPRIASPKRPKDL